MFRSRLSYVSAITLGLALFLFCLGLRISPVSAASCTNPSPIPNGYAAPCPVLSLSSYSITSSGPLSLTLSPNAASQYIWGTVYLYNGSSWVPLVVSSNYLTATTNYTIPSSDLSSLSQGNYYIASWDWTWNQSLGCYVGPGSTTCNTGEWRVQQFAVTSGGGGGQYSINNQQPVTPVEYGQNPASVFDQQIPSDALQHLWGNTSNVTASNNYGKCITTDCGNAAHTNGGTGSSWGLYSYDSYGNYGTNAFYYGVASDPYYIVNGCAYCQTGWTSGPFHAPDNALWPGSNYTGDADSQLTVWDEAQGVVVMIYGAPAYTTKTTIGACPGGSPYHAGTETDPCPIPSSFYSSAGEVASYYTSRDWQSTNWQGKLNLNSSLDVAPITGMVRTAELTEGVIPHAIYAGTDCVSAPGGSKLLSVFPGTGIPGTLACGTGVAGPQSTYRPQEGMLYFADYSQAQLNCLDPSQAVCKYSDGTAIPKVQPFQMIFINQLAHYGQYISETGGSSTATLHPYAGELDDVGTSWEFYGNPLGSPFWNWAEGIQSTSGANYVSVGGPRQGTNPSQESATLYTLSNIPLMPGLTGASDQSGRSCTSGHGCDLSGHIQVIDPCVVERMAGQPGAC